MIPARVLVAPDAFKGTLSAPEVADAVARGLVRGELQAPDRCPLADGGEGTRTVLSGALGGGEEILAPASDPLGRPLSGALTVLPGGDTAIVEVAEASGLTRISPEERDAEAASTRGTGELILAAVERGVRRILVAAGGSASTDGGAGALEAIAAGGGLRGASLTVLCDVMTPFEQAAVRFAPQKGADGPTVGRLSRRLQRLAADLPRDPRGLAMGGAAGGLAGGLWAALGARLVAGAPFVLEAVGFDTRMRAAHAVLTGEGRLDASTLEGKLVFEVCTRARQIGVPTHAIVGQNALERFDARILDLQAILEAGTVAEVERAGEAIAALL